MLFVLLAATDCAGARDDDVGASVPRSYEAVDAQDGATACRLLAPETRRELEESSGAPCPTAVLDEVSAAVGPRSVVVMSNVAQARGGGDVTFLSHFRHGWLITAAACRPRGHQSYDCLGRLLEPQPAELAVGVPRRRVVVALSIYLRERGSPESKPVGEPTAARGSRAEAGSEVLRAGGVGARGMRLLGEVHLLVRVLLDASRGIGGRDGLLGRLADVASTAQDDVSCVSPPRWAADLTRYPAGDVPNAPVRRKSCMARTRVGYPRGGTSHAIGHETGREIGRCAMPGGKKANVKNEASTRR